MKRQTRIILALFLALAVLTGCSQAAINSGSSDATVVSTATPVPPTVTPMPATATPAPPTATPALTTAPAGAPTQAPAEQPAVAWEPVVGAQVADFELVGVDGVTHKLSEYVGQGMILNFWATWCPHCQSEVPVFQEVYEARAEEGFVIIAVSVGESPDTVKEFVAEYGMTFPVLLDPTGEIGGMYGVSGIPASYFIDRTGTIRGTHVGAIADASALNGVVDALVQ